MNRLYADRFDKLEAQLTNLRHGQTGILLLCTEIKKSFYKTKKAPLRSAVKAAVKQEIQNAAELKEFQVTATGATTATAGVVIPLNSIAVGDEFNLRTGREIKTRYIDIMYCLVLNSTDTSAESGMVALVYDKQPNGSAAAWTDIFVNASPLTFKNTASNRERFHIAWMDHFPNQNEGSVQIATNSSIVSKRQFIKCADKYSCTRYNNTTAIPPSIGAWYLCVIAGNATGTYDYNTKYAYTDM